MGWNIDVPTTEYYGRLPGTNDWAPGAADRFQSVLNEVFATRVIAFDTETTGLNISDGFLGSNRIASHPLYFSLAWGNRRATLHADLLQYFTGIFADPSKWWIMANAKYDMHMAWLALNGRSRLCMEMKGHAVDTCVMHSLLYEEKPHGLKYMCQHIGGWSWGDFQDQFGKITVANPPSAIIARAEREDFPRLVEYAANDAWGTLLVYQELRKQLESAGTHSLFRTTPPYIETLWDLFYKVEVPYTKALWRMERHGIKVNQERLESARPEAEKYIGGLERKLLSKRGKPINLNSSPALRQWLIEELKLEPLNRTKGGAKGIREASVDAKFLKHHAERGNEVCSLILEHRSYSKLLGTYINGLHEFLDSKQRIHSRFNQDVARTGRLSNSDPNLQTIPKPEKDHWKLREAFIPEDGYDIIVFDYAQLEMRLLAAAALERPMLDMIHSGRDIHMGNAEIVFGMPYADISAAKDKKDRKEALTSYDKECLAARSAVKTIGFGLLYGMGAPKMASDLGISENEANQKIEQFLNTYPAVKRFTEECIEETERTGYAFTVLGRRRNIPEIVSRSRKDRSRGERLAVNTPIQGSAADVVKMAQILFEQLNFERDFGCRMILQVHDELIFECPKPHTKIVVEEVKELMAHPFSEDLAVQLLAEGGYGESWGAVK